MSDTVSIGSFRRRPLRYVDASQGKPLAVTSEGRITFYCLSTVLFTSLLEAAQIIILEGQATRRRSRILNHQGLVREEGSRRIPSSIAGPEPILFHPHASEEWRLLEIEQQRQVLELLGDDAFSPGSKLSEPFACLGLPDSSVRLVYERRPESFLVWAISDRLPQASDVRALLDGSDTISTVEFFDWPDRKAV